MESGPIFLRLLRWTAWSFATLLLCAIASLLYVTFVGITVDVSFLRTSIAQTFTANIGRPVQFDGPMEIRLSARPSLRVGGLHIANAPGFGDGDFASLGEARLALDLWPLLFERQLHIEELAGSNVKAHLQAKPDGTNNWAFQRPKINSTPASGSASTASISASQVFAALDINRVTLEELDVEYVDTGGGSHFFSLDSLIAQSPADAPFKLLLKGAVEKEFPYQLDFTGGNLSDLATDKPWPITFTLTFLSSTLSVDGSVSGAGKGEVTFGLGTENLLEFERLLQTRLPDVGASGIAATVNFSPRRITIKQLAGAMGTTTLTGELEFDATGPKPKLTGSLVAPTLDMRPFLGEKPSNSKENTNTKDDTAPPRNLAEVYRNLAAATFDLRRLNGVNADVTLGVERWLSLPGDVKDVRLQIKLHDGILHAPLTASIAGVTLAGQARADANANPPKFDLALGTSNSDLGGLAELLLGVRGVQGHLGRFGLSLAAQGDQGSELVQSLDVHLQVDRGRFSYGNVEGGRPVNFALDKLAVRLPPAKALAGNVRGALLGHPFNAILSAGALEPIMLQGRSPLDFRLRSGDVQARIHGTIEAPASDRGPDVAFEFSAPRAGELASWFGFRPGAQAPAALSGKASLRESTWQVRDFLLSVGRTSLSADLSRTIVDGTSLLKLRLDSEQIDIAQLESMLPKSQKPKTASERPALDIPLLPQEIDLSDADVSVNIKRIAGTAVQVRDVSFDGRIREGYMHPSPFSVNVANAGFSGAVLIDLRSAEPMAGLWLFAANLDVGQLLRTLGVARDLEATFSEFAVNLIARSSRLGDMLERSELLGAVGGGRIVLRDPNTHGEARITVDKGELRADPGMPLRLTLEGALDDVPVAIAVDTVSAFELTDPKLPLHFTLGVDTSNTRVNLAGNIARPIGSELELALDARGARFADLDQLTRASLPPWGPWSAIGKFRLSPRGYEVNDLRLQVGESVLAGQGRLDTESGRPHIVVALSAPVIQLDDFKPGDWSPVEKKPDKEPATVTVEEVRRKTAEASNQAQKLLSPEMLRRQDVSLKVEVKQVLSGTDKLGAGRMEARLENGRADIGPIEVEVPGGGARLQLGYEPTDQDVNVDLHIDVQQFDYGVLARRIKPGTDLGGTFSVKMDVDSRARYLSDILRHGNGRIEFAVWPQKMKAGVFDLWAVNVLVALVPEVDPDKASKVNCAIGTFDLSNGKLVDKTILLDTTRMRVTGTGKADFAKENFDIRMRPQAKTPQFLSLATPIQVSGPFNDFHISVSPGDVFETAARLVTSIVWVPLQKLSGKTIPADGRDVCGAPLQTLPARR
jgi:uncharacterized protein involved in outer membrane biogenesis